MSAANPIPPGMPPPLPGAHPLLLSAGPVVERTWMLPFAVVMETIPFILIAVRLISRIHPTHAGGQIGIDDLFISLGWILQLASVVLIVQQCNMYGFNRHIFDVPIEDFVPAFRLVWLSSILTVISTSCIKVSVLLFYRRLMKGVSSLIIKYAILSSIAFIILFTVAFVVLLLAECSPIDAVWQSLDPLYSAPHRCIDQHGVLIITFFANGIFLFTDVLCVTLPAIVVMRLSLDCRSRLALLLVFSIGYLTCIAGIVRMIYVAQIQDAKYLDKTWAGFNAYVTGIVEGSVGIMCACAPSLRRFLSIWFRGEMHSSNSSQTAKTPSCGESAAKHSVRSERDADRYPGVGGVYDGYGDKAPYLDEPALEPQMASTGRKKAAGGSFYFDSSGEERKDIRLGTGS